MKNLIIMILLLALSTSQMFAQIPKINWGPEYKTNGGENLILGSDGKFFYTINGDRSNPNIAKFDMNCRLISITPLDINSGQEKGEELWVYNVLSTNGHTYLTYLSRNGKTQTSNFYYSELANGGLTPPKKLHSLGIDQTFSNYFAYKEHANVLQFNTSPNKKLVVKYNPGGADSKSDKAQTATIAVFDEALNISWKKEFSLPSNLNKFAVRDIAINNNGEVFLLALGFNYKNDAFSNHTSSLFVLTKDGQSKYIINENQDKQCDANRIYIAPDNSAIVAGLYKDDNQYKIRQLGLFFAKYANKNIETNFYPFTESYMASLRIYDEEVKNKCLESYESTSYHKFYPDGSFTFIAAGEYFITEYTSAGFIIPRFSSNGELLSLGKISRMLRNGRDINHPQSLAFLTKGEDMYIMFNSMVDENGKIPKGGIGTNICKIPETGSVSLETLFTNKDKDSKMILSSMFFLDLGNGKYLIRKAFDEKYHYGIIEL